MRGSSTAWARGVAALVALVIALSFGAPPCSAADAKPGTVPKAPAKQSLSAAAAAHVAAAAPPRAFAQDATGTATSGGSKSFFSTPTGVAAIVLMAVGGGYTLYSVSHDQKPVKSPIR